MKTAFAGTQRGFTLLELSIVLVLIAVIIGGGLVVMTSSLQASQYNVTVARMDEIEKALLNYALANNRIPCPTDLTLTTSSVNYGLEAGAGSGSAIGTATGVCTGAVMLPQANFVATSGAVEGGVPTRALQLPDEYMYDGWGRKFRYAVDPTQTASGALPASVSGGCNSTSAITVNDASGAARTTAAAYALISHGANGHGAYTSHGVTLNAGSVNANEQTNCHCTSSGVATTYAPTYVEKVPMQDASNALDNFDDIVTFKEGWQMQAQNYPLSSAATSTAQHFAAYPYAGNSPFYYYTICGNTVTGALGTWTQGSLTGMAYPPDNAFLYVGYTAYNQDGAFTTLSDGTVPSSTPAGTWSAIDGYGWGPFISSDSKYIAIPERDPGIGVEIAKYSGGAWGRLATVPITAPYYSENVDFSPDTNYLAVGLEWGGPPAPSSALLIYQRTSDTFSLSASQPDVSLQVAGDTSDAVHVKYSPDGTYLYAACAGCTDGKGLRIYTINCSASPCTYTYLAGQPDVIPSSVGNIAVSPSNTYLALTHCCSSFLLYKRTGGSTFTQLTTPSPSPTNSVFAIQFSADSKYLIMVSADYPYVYVYSINSTTDTFTALPTPSLLPPGFFSYMTAMH